MKKAKNRQLKRIMTFVMIVVILQLLFWGKDLLRISAETNVEYEEQVSEEIASENDLLTQQLDMRDVPSFITQENIVEYGHIKRLYEHEMGLNTVVFQNSDGSNTIYYMDYPIKYYDEEGESQEINLTIKEENDVYCTTANDIALSFSKDITNGLTLSYKGFSIQMMAMVNAFNDVTDNIETSEMFFIQVEEDSVTHKNVFGSGVDVRYTPIYNGVKEDILLSTYTGVNSFEFLLSTGGLAIYETMEGDFYIAESEEAEERVEIGNVLAYDSENDMCEGTLMVTPIKEGQLYQLTISVDELFLTDSNTLYPVLIDPTLTISDATHGADSIQDCPIYLGLPDKNFGSNYYNYTGYADSTYKVGRTVVRLYGLLNDSVYKELSAAAITSAKFYVKDSSGTSKKTVNLYALTGKSSWTESGMTWNTLGSLSPTLQCSANIGSAEWTSFDITSLVKGWKNDTYNELCGFVMMGADENTKSNFYSSEHSTTSNRPYVALTYLNGQTSGIESGQTYFIKNLYSNRYLQADTSLNRKVIQNAFHGDSYQQWKIIYQGNGLYKLCNQYAGYIGRYCYLDLVSKSGSSIDLYTESTGDFLLFYILPNGNGTYRIINYWPRTEAALTVPDQYALSEVYNSTWTSDTKQQWILELANTKLENTKTFSVFNIGDSTEDEAAVVEKYLEYDGYTSVGIYDNQNYYVPAQTIKDVGRYSDIVYINGHGGFYSNLYVKNSEGQIEEYLCADDTVEPQDDVPKIGIGAQWKSGSTTKTNSYWNKKTKWVIFTQCDQLNYGNRGGQEHWKGLDPAQVWARTMLGDGVRVHGYLGYYNAAPGAAAHLERLEDFLIHSSKDNNMTLINAWKTAHNTLTGKTNWAMLYHSENADDSFSQMTANTVNGAAYTIYLVRREYSTTQLGLDSSVSTLHTTENVGYLNSCPILTNNVTVDNVSKIYANLQSQLQLNINSILKMEENGRIIYTNWNSDLSNEDLGYELSDEEAVMIAKKTLAELDLLPEEDYRISVSKTERLQLNVSTETFTTPETIEYSVCFYRTYNGIDLISDQEDGIILSFNRDGITELKYLWRNMEITESEQMILNSVLSLEQVNEIYQAEFANSFSYEGENPIISKAYLQIGNEVKPVWVCSTDYDYTNSIYIDMYSGEILSIE